MTVRPRIASLLSSATEIVAALGLDRQLCAIGYECDYPLRICDRPRVTKSFIDAQANSSDIDRQVQSCIAETRPLYGLDCELLIELAPDLILAQAQCDVCAIRLDEVERCVRGSAKLQHTQIIALQPNSLDDVLANIEEIGRAAAAVEQAEQVVAGLRRRLRSVEKRVKSHRPPTVVCIEWIDPLMIAANWTPDLIACAGGANQISSAGVHSEYREWQAVLDAAPECLLISPCGFGVERTAQEASQMADWPGWQDIPAVRNRNVWLIDGNALLNRPGPRLVDSVEILARLFHPDDAMQIPLAPDVTPRFRRWASL